MRDSSVAMMLIAATALSGCGPTLPYDPNGRRCEVSSTNGKYVGPVWYRLAVFQPPDWHPSVLTISCVDPQASSSGAYFSTPYPPQLGTTVFPPDSGSDISGLYTSPAGVTYATWGAGTSGSVTITAWDSTTGEISGTFSFTARAIKLYANAPTPTPIPIVASGSFFDALKAPSTQSARVRLTTEP